MYREIYLRSSNSLYSIMASVLCKKWSNIDSNSIIPCGFIPTEVSLCYVFDIFCMGSGMYRMAAEVCMHRWPNQNKSKSMWHGSAKHSGNDEIKHDKITFQLAAVDLNSSTLMVRNLCARRCILKDNSWMCILHQYHKTSWLNKSAERCVGSERNYYYGVNIHHILSN